MKDLIFASYTATSLGDMNFRSRLPRPLRWFLAAVHNSSSCCSEYPTNAGTRPPRAAGCASVTRKVPLWGRGHARAHAASYEYGKCKGMTW
eukprot:2720267-Pleurochrysis_carterae.AAC.1